MTISREAYFEDLLSVKNLKRPSNLAKVVVDLSTKECNDEADPKSFVEKFQLLLNCASSKENFAFNGGTVQGCCSPELSELMAGRGEVWLFSTEECLPKENWIEFYPYGEAIARG
jgi:hypothetical protein